MTTDEYRELIAFLGTKFGEVDIQFQAVGDRLQRVETGLADVRRDMFEFRGEVDERFQVFRAEPSSPTGPSRARTRSAMPVRSLASSVLRGRDAAAVHDTLRQ